jgi:hypothetical protein
MRRRARVRWTSSRVAAVLLGLSLFFPAATMFAQEPSPKGKEEKKSDQPQMVKLRIQVTAGDPGKPVDNASVYIRYDEPGGLFHRNKQAELNFKTNQEGSVKVPEVPRGKVLIQVVAKGWHTFGKWYDIEGQDETIQIKLEKPPKWY